MNTSYDDALREVATQCPSDTAMLDTLSFYHPSAGYYNIVNDREDLFRPFFLGSTTVQFKASSFAVSLPDSNSDGVQNLKITVPNVDNVASNWLEKIPINDKDPIEVIYRVYLKGTTNTNGPSNNPPIVMYIRDIQIDIFPVSAVAVFKSVVNKKYPSEYYTLEKFPSLGT